MIPAYLSPLANHLWQSSFFAAVVWLLTLALRQNRAAVRYGLWLAASVKFLVPFSLLVSTAGQFGWRVTPPVGPAPVALVMEQMSQPFALPPEVGPATESSNPVPVLLFSI